MIRLISLVVVGLMVLLAPLALAKRTESFEILHGDVTRSRRTLTLVDEFEPWERNIRDIKVSPTLSARGYVGRTSCIITVDGTEVYRQKWADEELYRPLPWRLVETANIRRRLEYQIEVDPDRNCILWEEDPEGSPVDPESSKHFMLFIMYDYEFPEKTLVVMRNGDQLSGLIWATSVDILTTYGKLSLQIEEIASIQFEGRDRPDAIVKGKNGERFSGFVLNPSISMEQTATGLELDLRKEKIESIIFRIEKLPMAPRDKTIFHMRNGDTFWGRFISEQVSVDTEFGTLTVSVENIEEIELVGDEAVVSKITLRGGDTLRGILKDEDFEISVAGYEPIKIYRDKFARIIHPCIR